MCRPEDFPPYEADLKDFQAPTMRDRLAADLHFQVCVYHLPEPFICGVDHERDADRLIALGWTRGPVPADPHTTWQGACGHLWRNPTGELLCPICPQITLDEDRLARAIWEQETHVCDAKFRNCAAAIAAAYREDEG